MRLRTAWIGFLTGIVAAIGCRTATTVVTKQSVGRARVVKPAALEQPKGPPKLQLQIVFASRPVGDKTLNEHAWQATDETILPLERQEKLRAAGFRVGVLSGQPPEALDLLLRETPEGTLNGHYLAVHSGRATAVLVATYKECPAPLAKLVGQPMDEIRSPRCVLSVLPTLQADETVQLHVTPAVQYGDLKRRFVPEFGPGGVRQWTLEITPNQHPIRQLAWTVTLRDDEYLLIGCYPERGESPGAVFLIDRNATPPRQMLVLIHAAPAT